MKKGDKTFLNNLIQTFKSKLLISKGVVPRMGIDTQT